ncbi:helix-turn-helix domain-containing protein [Sodaliphilus sp.]|uniref:AraC family transcriptional regulator n=1 Tax=Sodaliphilus sp. TaxID=2815818 RepID=UPI00388FA48F
MSIDYFIYIILYITVMVLIFAMSFVMLHPRTRVIFKIPVPHIHDTIGKLMIPWGITYLIFLPDMYLYVNKVPWRDYAYVVVSLVTLLMCLSISPWSYMACLQQKVRHSIFQPAILLIPSVITIWYAINPDERLVQAFFVVLLVEVAVIVCYYVKLYRAFVRDIKKNYSSFSISMIRGLWAQWIASLFSVIVFLVNMSQDTALWGLLNIMANVFTIVVVIYTSEHLMPLPEETEVVEDDDMLEEDHVIDMAKALQDNCEASLLFCNPDLSLQDLSVAVGTNRTYLSKWFADNDTTFYHYINRLRIDHAAHLLLTTDYSIKKIQTDAGFASKTTFRKYFLDSFGCSPSDYRRGRPDAVPES